MQVLCLKCVVLACDCPPHQLSVYKMQNAFAHSVTGKAKADSFVLLHIAFNAVRCYLWLRCLSGFMSCVQ